MAALFDGGTWAIIGGHVISTQGQKQPHFYHKWREKPFGWKNPISPRNPKTLYKTGVYDSFDELPRMAHFIWMIAWVRESLIGNEIPHFFHHSYFEEAMGQQAGFHSHLPPLIYVIYLFLHTWEETLEGSFIADYFDVVMEAIDGRT